MISIRKLLSRKFNIVCLNLAGLLARFMLFHLPILFVDSGIEENNIPSGCLLRAQTYSCGNSSGFTPDSLLIVQKNALHEPKFSAKIIIPFNLFP